MSAYKSIRQGLTEAIDFATGKQTVARVSMVEVPTADVAAITSIPVDNHKKRSTFTKCSDS